VKKVRKLYFSAKCKRAITLLEPFEDFDITLRSYSRLPHHKTVRTYEPKHYPLRIPLRKLKAQVKDLQQRYAKHNYRLVTRTLFARVNGRLRKIRFHIIRRGKACMDNPPVYYDPRAGRFFVPRSYVEGHKRLTRTVVYYRLRALGVKMEG